VLEPIELLPLLSLWKYWLASYKDYLIRIPEAEEHYSRREEGRSYIHYCKAAVCKDNRQKRSIALLIE
jgi:hypothetical protein